MGKLLHWMTVSLLVMLVGGLVLSGCAKPPPAALKHVVLAYTSPTAVQSTMSLAKEKDLFAKYGLDAEIQYIVSGLQSAAVAGGHVDIGGSAADTIMGAKLGGADFVGIGLLLPTMQAKFYSQANIRSAAALKGKVVLGNGPFPNVIDASIDYALAKLGLDPYKDVVRQYINENNARYAAFFSGQGAATYATPPWDLKMEQAGYYLLYDVRKDNVLWPSNGFYTTPNFAAKNRDVVLAFCKAIMEAIWVTKNEPDFTTDFIMKFEKDEDRAVAKWGQQYLAEVLPRVPRWTEQAMTTTLVNLAYAGRPEARAVKATDLYDNSFWDELERTGFVDKIWGKGK